MAKVPFEADTYPYERVQSGYTRFIGAEEIPMKIIRYLLDLPDANGYMPVDDNSRARVRIAKYLWHEGVNPLGQALPTPQEKLSLLFDGDDPELNTDEQKAKHPKGYRLFPQVYWGPVELTAQVLLKCYIARVVPTSEFDARIGIAFQIIVNSNLESTTRTDAYSRAYAIETALIEALHGVNITGIGTVSFSRRDHIDNGSSPLHDNGTHVGRQVHFSIDWMEGNTDCVV